jgi:hypothetical protein
MYFKNGVQNFIKVERKFEGLTVSTLYTNCNTKWKENLRQFDGWLVVRPSGWSRSEQWTFWALYKSDIVSTCI